MECFNDKCACSSMCNLINSCVIQHPLFEGFRKSVSQHITDAPISRRPKVIIDLLQKIQQPKVNGRQIDRYYLVFKHKGIDLDKDFIGKRQRNFHKKFKILVTRSKRDSIILKPDEEPEPNFHIFDKV